MEPSATVFNNSSNAKGGVQTLRPYLTSYMKFNEINDFVHKNLKSEIFLNVNQ